MLNVKIVVTGASIFENKSDVVRNNVKMTLGKSEKRVEGSQLKAIDITSGKEEVLEDRAFIMYPNRWIQNPKK